MAFYEHAHATREQARKIIKELAQKIQNMVHFTLSHGTPLRHEILNILLT